MAAKAVAKRSDARRNRGRLLAVARAMMAAGDVMPAFNALARRAGVGVGTVYRHFPDEDALLVALAEPGLEALAALVVRATAERQPLAALDVLVRGAVALQQGSPVLARLLASPRRRARKLARQLDALDAAGEAILARARRARLVRRDVGARDLVRLAAAVEVASRDGDTPATTAATYVDIILAGLRRPR